MDGQELAALVERLRDPVARVRDRRQDTPELMPDDPDLCAELAALRAEHARGVPVDAFWLAAGLVLYGPADVPIAGPRCTHALAYLRRHRRRGRANVFRQAALLQLVFAYALGVRREPGSLSGETLAQAAAWGGAPWGPAVGTLRRCLIGLAVWLVAGLRRLGLRGIDLLDEFDRGRAFRDDPAFGRRVADHTLGVLLGDTQCVCVLFFREANPGSPAGRAEERHEHWHTLAGWLDKRWPAGRDYAARPFSIGEFVFRAACGGEPNRPRAFETGIWFPLVRSCDAPLVVLKVLVCESCRTHLTGFEDCTGCPADRPVNRVIDWLVTADDTRFRESEGKECRRCGRLAPLDQVACPCGSPGTGFSRAVPQARAAGARRAASRKRCLACDALVPLRTHACPHCPNADYGGVTHFHLRHAEPGRDSGDGSAHRGPGGRRTPLPPRADEPEGSEP